MSASKKKGTAAESDVVAYLRENGFPHAERRALHGTGDQGDIAGIPGVMIEVKNKATLALAEWMTEVARQARELGASIGVCWHKRRMKGSPADWYVTMDGATFVHLLRYAGWGTPSGSSGDPWGVDAGGALARGSGANGDARTGPSVVADPSVAVGRSWPE